MAPAWVLEKLKWFAREHGFRVTAGSGGTHNVGSLHKLNRAIDVSVRGKTDAQVEAFMRACTKEGYEVLDERVRPSSQAVWFGPHAHVQDRADYDLNNDGE
jgi:hypothetical protein